MRKAKSITAMFMAVILSLLTLSSCGNKQSASDQPNSSLSPTNVSTSDEEQSSMSMESTTSTDPLEDLTNKFMGTALSDDDSKKNNVEVYSDKNFFLISHATVSNDSVVNPGNDAPEDYFDVASPYESFSYYEDGSPLSHEVHYVEGGYYEERWEQDENGNVTRFDGRTGNNQVVYIYDEDNHLIQEWGHNMNYRPDSVTIYDDYDKHGNYGSTVRIITWGGSIVKEGGTWYDLDSLDYDEVQSTTHYYYAYEYDEAGRLTSAVRTNHDGSDKSTHTYEYDSQGNLIYEYEYDSGDVYIREYHSNGEIALLQVKWNDQLKEEIVYDTHGNPISKFSELDYTGTITTYENEYDINENLVRRFTYDEEGNCKCYDIWRYIDEQSYIESYIDYMWFD